MDCCDVLLMFMRDIAMVNYYVCGSTKLPVGHCVKLLKVDAFAIADVTKVCKTSVDKA